MNPVDMVLARVTGAKQTARDRWRCACPVCGEGNRSTLSIGVGDTGAVLFKCFKSECDPEAITGALGLNLSDLFPPKLTGSAPMRRRGLLSASQALDLLHTEAQLVALAGSNLAHGVELTDADRDRVLQAAGRIAYLRDEVMA